MENFPWNSVFHTGCYVCHLIPVNSMKLPGDPWDNLWSGFYGIAWNFSMEFHGKCPNHLWKISMENFHGNWFPFPPWNSMASFPMEFHGKCPNPP